MNPKKPIPINIADNILPATIVSKKVKAKNPITNAIVPPVIKHFPNSQMHSFVSFFCPNAAVTYNKINEMAANTVDIATGIAIISVATIPIKNATPNTRPNIAAMTIGNIQILLFLHIIFQLLL